MSKRARITLDLDPEPAETESVAAATPKAAPEKVATAVSGSDDKARVKPKARAEIKPRAKSKAKPKSRAKPKAKARVETKQEQSRKPEVRATAEEQTDTAANWTADAGRRPHVRAAPQERFGSGFETGPAKTARPSAPPPDMWNLGTVLKVAAVGVGLIAVTVALWLKRKP